MYILSLFEDCKIYLCGTKLDLIEEAIQPRDVQTKTVVNYGRGEFRSLFLNIDLLLHFTSRILHLFHLNYTRI